MDRLIEGFRSFRHSYWRPRRETFRTLVASGQAPQTMMIACSDSRVDPQIMFSAEPGEIFMVRNVANLVPAYGPDGAHHSTSAAIEFAVRSLEVPNLVVLGHVQCGGITALLRGAGERGQDFLAPWMRIAAPARARALELAKGDAARAQRLCEHESVKNSLANLMTFPWIAERVAAGKLALHGWYIDIRAGELLELAADGEFRPVVAALLLSEE
jgi:carbonic anhydrase